MTVATSTGFKVYDGVPVADLAGYNMAILGHYDKQTALKAFERHAREQYGWADLYDAHPHYDELGDNVGCYVAVILDACQAHGRERPELCPMCELVDAETTSLLLVDEFTPGAFPVTLWSA